MTRPDLALVVSAVSLLISGASLFWNVRKEFGLKPRIEVSFSVTEMRTGNGTVLGRFLLVKAVNHGPGSLTLNRVACKSSYASWKFRGAPKYYHWVLYPDNTSSELPKNLDRGDDAKFLFPIEKAGDIPATVDRVGVMDTLNREYWCRRADVRKVKQNAIAPRHSKG